MRIPTIAFALLMGLALYGVAQEDETRLITSFEESQDWAYAGASEILDSVVDVLPSPEGVPALDGEFGLYVEYDNNGNQWPWETVAFPPGVDPVDLTGMTEIHMWCYWVPERTEGEMNILLVLPGNLSLGAQSTDTAGEWVELVWQIDAYNSATNISDVSWWMARIGSGDGSAKGVLFIDNIFGVRPAGTPELEYILVYGFNEEDPATGEPMGWTAADGQALLGEGQVEPSEGANYMELQLGSAWVNQVRTTDAIGAFDRWLDVVSILLDVRVPSDFAGSWGQSPIAVQSSGNSWATTAEQGFADATGDWKTLVWNVDMTEHAPGFEEGGWFQFTFITNNGADAEGELVFIDNFRVAVPVEAPVLDWSVH